MRFPNSRIEKDPQAPGMLTLHGSLQQLQAGIHKGRADGESDFDSLAVSSSSDGKEARKLGPRWEGAGLRKAL